MNLFKRIVPIKIGVEFDGPVVLLEVFPFGICRWNQPPSWVRDLRIFMYPHSKEEYSFLKRHIGGNWWILNSEFVKFPKDNKFWAVRFTRKGHKFLIWRTENDYKDYLEMKKKEREAQQDPPESYV